MTTLNLNLKEIQVIEQGIANMLSYAPETERKFLIDLYETFIDLEQEIMKEEALIIKYQK